MQLCTRPEGHDFNKLDRGNPNKLNGGEPTLRSRFYGADIACRRGDCTHQICVNDGVVVDLRICNPKKHPKDYK
jgi:hypothetical protein